MTTADEGRSRAEIERYARQIGLVNLSPEHLDEFARAEAYMRGYRVQFPRDLTYADEPAAIFRASDEVR